MSEDDGRMERWAEEGWKDGRTGAGRIKMAGWRNEDGEMMEERGGEGREAVGVDGVGR